MLKIVFLLIIFTSSIFAREVNWERYYEQYPKYRIIISKWVKYYDLQEVWIQAIICWESGWTEKAIDATGTCFGLMQVKGGSKDPDKNIQQGCKKLKDALMFFDYDLYWAFNGYNAGCGKANKWKKAGKKWGYATKIFEIIHRIETIDLELKIRYKLEYGDYGEDNLLRLKWW